MCKIYSSYPNISQSLKPIQKSSVQRSQISSRSSKSATDENPGAKFLCIYESVEQDISRAPASKMQGWDRHMIIVTDIPIPKGRKWNRYRKEFPVLMILRIWPGRIPFPRGSDGKCGRPGSIPGLGRSPGGGHGNPLQYSCLDNPMDRGAWRAAVHGLAKSQTPLNNKAQHIYKIMSLCMISFLNFFFNFLFSIVV